MSAVATKALAAVGRGQDSGMCEKFTRTCFGLPARYGSARLAYEASKRDGKIHLDTNPPAGVPVYWDILTGVNAPYDHVAVSVGGGYCVSTSAGPGKTVAKVLITDLTKRWGMIYRGWAEVYHEQRVWTPPKKGAAYPLRQMTETNTLAEIYAAYKVLLTALGYKTPHMSATGLMQTWLKAMGQDVGPIDGDFGPRSKRALQRRLADKSLRRPYTGPIDGLWGGTGSATRISASALLNDRINHAKKG